MPDRIEELITALCATGIDFVREAWIDENNDMGRRDYGVVTLSGEPAQIWGDDQLIMQSQKGEVILYLMDGDARKAHAVQEVLREQEDLSFTVGGHEFLPDLLADRWRWRIELSEYLLGLEDPEDGEADGEADGEGD